MRWVDVGGVRWHVEWRGHAENPVLAMVHGFAGSLRTWDALLPELETKYRVLLVDLPGHGDTPFPEKADFALRDLWEALGKLLLELSPDPPLLCGYSMGGRIALHVGIHAPNFLHRLILIGASPGIESETERTARQLSDHKLAEDILLKGTEWFADYWATLPLFESQKRLPTDVQARLRDARIRCDARGLAYALERFGTGRQEFLAGDLHKLTCPLLLLAGALDEKFCASNRLIAAHCGSTSVHRLEILDAGHAVHIEKPSAVVREIIAFAELL
ncbi:2-succinyl-6-hydroxy-2,4-cyclohexadiene-1-carboxylate synthase [bacterium]|nr:2-succinyl-6-hydroxy-2,4-cyclohexadiene-1-carboxylate synthase [bacterium]MBU1985577.1 2-succinyl-6-hydroxy-2,4-cyclohexadiene-1-carboxylate synthase [bacterium]